MKVNEAIAQIDNLRPNAVSEKIKRDWLTRVDRYVFEEIISAREDAKAQTFEPYGDGDGERDLLVGEPYAELYIFYLEGMIYYATRELDKMSSSMALYNETIQNYKAKYFAEHRQKGLPATRYW